MDRCLVEGNRTWITRMNSEDPDFFTKLGLPQEPLFLYIGCSDARVDPIKLLGLELGKLFVHRNVGNLVYENDENLMTVIEYAMNVLHIPYILVVGHYDCGAVRAALNYSDIKWLSKLRTIADEHRNELDTSPDSARKLVELSVQEQCSTIKNLCFSMNLEVPPTVYGFVFDPKDGVLKQLYK